MTADQRDRLVHEFPREVGNTDGVPWPLRVAANVGGGPVTATGVLTGLGLCLLGARAAGKVIAAAPASTGA